MPQFHRFDNAVNNQRGAEAGSQTQKKHFAAPVTPQRLHGGVVDDLDRAFECRCEIESHPALSQIPRFRHRPVVDNRPRVADGYGVVFPIRDKLPDF